MRLFAMFTAAALVTGCSDDFDKMISPPVEPGDTAPEHPVALGGPIALRDHIDLDLDDVVADRAALTHYIHGYVNAPGATMIEAAANVPALATLRAQLTTEQQAALPGYIDESIAATARLGIASLELGVDHALKKFDLVGELSQDGGTAVDPIIRHALTTIDFTPMGYAQTFTLAPVSATADSSLGGYALLIGEHTIDIEVGGFAWDAVDAQMADRGGMRGVLGDLTMCSIVALSVATKIGHADLMQSICEGALDEIVDGGRAQAAGLKLHLVLSGQVGVDDANRDGIGDGLFGGEWAAQLTVDGEPTSVTIAFD